MSLGQSDRSNGLRGVWCWQMCDLGPLRCFGSCWENLKHYHRFEYEEVRKIGINSKQYPIRSSAKGLCTIRTTNYKLEGNKHIKTILIDIRLNRFKKWYFYFLKSVTYQKDVGLLYNVQQKTICNKIKCASFKHFMMVCYVRSIGLQCLVG
jgi:5,10-methylene-tetrahydrofolate dehydrogenase/methenyl tetrahydrofolate cyclohydrolase